MSDGSQSPVKRFVRSSGIMAVFYAAAMVLAFFAGIVLTRSLGAHGYGVYSLALTTATLVGLVTEFGLPVLALREAGSAWASGNWGLLRGLMRWSDRAILVLSLLLIAGTWGVIYFSGRAGDSEFLETMLWAVALITLVGLAKLRSSVLLALDRVAAGQFAVMIVRPLMFLAVCLAIPAVTGGLTATTAIIAQVGGALASLALVAALYRRWRPPELSSAAAQRDVRGWLSASVPMGVTEGLRLLQGQLALLLTGWLAGATAAGVYRGADAVMQLATVGASVVATAATPMFARLIGESDHEGIKRIAVLTSVIMVAGVVVVALPIALAGNWLFPALFGQDFAASPPVFAILAVGLLGTYSMGLAQALANMSGHHLLTTQSFLTTALCNLVLGLVLIPRFGAVGAAIATAMSAIVGTAWCAWQLARRTGYNTTVFNLAMPGILQDYGRLGLALVRGSKGGK
jgi:O-antigen/teichoic acid export membrane protein